MFVPLPYPVVLYDERIPNRVAAKCGDALLTWREPDDLTNRFAFRLLQRDIGRGDNAVAGGEASTFCASDIERVQLGPNSCTSGSIFLARASHQKMAVIRPMPRLSPGEYEG